MPTYKLPTSAFPALAIRTLLCFGSLGLAGAQAQSPGASDAARVDTQSLVTELARLVDEAERTRTADRRFLEELRRFIDDYDRPWTRVVLRDTFADGDYARGPTWTVREGDFQVDGRYGLVGRPAAPERSQSGSSGKDLAVAIIGSLLQQGQGGGSSQAPVGSATIETNAALSNAFALEVDVAGVAQGAGFDVAVAQGATGNTGYRLRMVTGRDPTLELLRDGTRGTAVVGSYQRPLRANASGQQLLRWTRARNGRMRVSHNGETVLETVDRGLSNDFSRVVLSAHGGEVAVRRVEAAALP